MKPAPFELHACRSLPEAIALLAAGDGMAKAAGGTQSLGPMLNLRLAQPAQLVDVSRVEALRGFALQGETLRIGAGVTHARIEDGQLPEITRGLLPAVAGGIAYRAVRNRGTLGGSLAHADPAADWVSTMTLLDATLVLLGPVGERRLRAGAFFLGPFTTALREDELLVAIEIRRFSPRARWAYRKACRKPGEFAQAIAAVWTDSTHGSARVVLGALGGMPHVIEGQGALELLRTDAGLERALDDAGLVEAYERQLHATMLRRALADLDASE